MSKAVQHVQLADLSLTSSVKSNADMYLRQLHQQVLGCVSIAMETQLFMSLHVSVTELFDMKTVELQWNGNCTYASLPTLTGQNHSLHV